MTVPFEYTGREQAYAKHTFLKNYLESLVFKTASRYSHVVYVDGFAGPWQSASEKFEDTSFAIALAALRAAKARWKSSRDVSMSAYLVEQNKAAFAELELVPSRYRDIEVKAYHADFMEVLPTILDVIPSDAFAFFFLDPKGWKVSLESLRRMLQRRKSEVIFNFMFDFINRAAGIDAIAIQKALDELMPFGGFREKLARVDASEPNAPEVRKEILVGAFGESLQRIGGFQYVTETTVQRPLKDRPLYCLFYATRHSKGIEVFRDHQVRMLSEQSQTRAETKIKHAQNSTGQAEIFPSLHDMAPDEGKKLLEAEKARATQTFLEIIPTTPSSVTFSDVWPVILSRHIIRLTDLNRIAAQLYKDGKIAFPDWEKGRKVPQPAYRVHRN